MAEWTRGPIHIKGGLAQLASPADRFPNPTPDGWKRDPLDPGKPVPKVFSVPTQADLETLSLDQLSQLADRLTQEVDRRTGKRKFSPSQWDRINQAGLRQLSGR